MLLVLLVILGVFVLLLLLALFVRLLLSALVLRARRALELVVLLRALRVCVLSALMNSAVDCRCWQSPPTPTIVGFADLNVNHRHVTFALLKHQHIPAGRDCTNQCS